MNNFIFPIVDIFSKCLQENKVHGYYIGPYQRGYKWKSTTIHDQVPVLLCHLFDSFIKSLENKSATEYYLQYITVKRTLNNGQYYLEVIDGQQRLTTITLIFSVLSNYFNQENIAKKKDYYLLKYSRYESSSVNIFDQIEEMLRNDETDIESVNEQDKYYLYYAYKTIKDFFEILISEDQNMFQLFISFLKNNVKIILNREDEFTSAEEVFSSLNGNKVPLTNAYLIKGLLLTKASRVSFASEGKLHFKEIMDQRNIMAKNWDEMHNWFTQADVSKYFLRNEIGGMDGALRLIKHDGSEIKSSVINIYKSNFEQSTKKSENEYELFNSFHENILSANDAFKYLIKIKHLYKRLKSWYEDNNMYNLLGYFLSTGGKIEKILSEKNNEVERILCQHVYNQIDISVANLANLSYDHNPKNKINKILLAFSVFPEGVNRKLKSNYRFDFYSYANEGWSLEHIFPQNPGDSSIAYKEDKDWLTKKCQDNNREDLILKIKNDEDLKGQDLSFIYDVFPDPHVLGNMALLSVGINSALSNGLFNTKRRILLKKINRGSFVPKHTVDVFSKMLEIKKETEENWDFDKDLMIWSINDAAAHSQWISRRLETLKSEFAR